MRYKDVTVSGAHNINQPYAELAGHILCTLSHFVGLCVYFYEWHSKASRILAGNETSCADVIQKVYGESNSEGKGVFSGFVCWKCICRSYLAVTISSNTRDSTCRNGSATKVKILNFTDIMAVHKSFEVFSPHFLAPSKSGYITVAFWELVAVTDPVIFYYGSSIFLRTATFSFGRSLEIWLQLFWYDFLCVSFLILTLFFLLSLCRIFSFRFWLRLSQQISSVRHHLALGVAVPNTHTLSHTLFEKTKWSKRACLRAHYNVWLLFCGCERVCVCERVFSVFHFIGSVRLRRMRWISVFGFHHSSRNNSWKYIWKTREIVKIASPNRVTRRTLPPLPYGDFRFFSSCHSFCSLTFKSFSFTFEF